MSPVIGQLTDDNSDNYIDWRDTPDIVIITDDNGAAVDRHGVLRIISGLGMSNALFPKFWMEKLRSILIDMGGCPWG